MSSVRKRMGMLATKAIPHLVAQHWAFFWLGVWLEMYSGTAYQDYGYFCQFSVSIALL